MAVIVLMTQLLSLLSLRVWRTPTLNIKARLTFPSRHDDSKNTEESGQSSIPRREDTEGKRCTGEMPQRMCHGRLRRSGTCDFSIMLHDTPVNICDVRVRC